MTCANQLINITLNLLIQVRSSHAYSDKEIMCSLHSHNLMAGRNSSNGALQSSRDGVLPPKPHRDILPPDR